MNKSPQLVDSISEDDLRQKCLDAIRRDPETARTASSGHERGVIILVYAVMKQIRGQSNPTAIRQMMLRCLRG